MSRPSFAEKVGVLLSNRPHTLQVNLGKRCNQACRHCHVDAGPKRTENMDLETVNHVLSAIDLLGVQTLDLTGGAPEMNPHFRYMIAESRARGVRQIIDRCNLTILTEPGYEWLAPFLAEHRVEVVASMPFYIEENVDRQRGDGVFVRSIQGLQLLNELGYGSELPLHLVYNPQGAYMPPDQAELKETYQRHLGETYQIQFNDLYTLTNMPIARFATYLRMSGNLEAYMDKLVRRFNPSTLDSLMCRNLISVGYDGSLYDCDFNQMLDLAVSGSTYHIKDIRFLMTEGRVIQVADHCYGCTAGSGSSCGGALTSENGAAKSIAV